MQSIKLRFSRNPALPSLKRVLNAPPLFSSLSLSLRILLSQEDLLSNGPHLSILGDPFILPWTSKGSFFHCYPANSRASTDDRPSDSRLRFLGHDRAWHSRTVSDPARLRSPHKHPLWSSQFRRDIASFAHYSRRRAIGLREMYAFRITCALTLGPFSPGLAWNVKGILDELPSERQTNLHRTKIVGNNTFPM